MSVKTTVVNPTYGRQIKLTMDRRIILLRSMVDLANKVNVFGEGEKKKYIETFRTISDLDAKISSMLNGIQDQLSPDSKQLNKDFANHMKVMSDGWSEFLKNGGLINKKHPECFKCHQLLDVFYIFGQCVTCGLKYQVVRLDTLAVIKGGNFY